MRAGDRLPWHPGRCAELLVGEVVVGHAGELHPRVCVALELPPRTCAMELDLDALPERTAVQGPRISAFPPVHTDLALSVPEGTPAADVESALRSGAGELLESLALFDVYTGEQAGAGQRSLAYALTFRAPDRTLTRAEVAEAVDAALVSVGAVGGVRRA